MSKLYEIANEYAALVNSDAAEEMGIEFIQDTLDGIECELADKVENVLMLIKNKQHYAEALKSEAKSFSERAKAEDATIERLKQYVISSLNTAGIKSLKAGLQSVTIRSPVKSVEVLNAAKIPVNFVEFETVIKPNKLEIKKQLEAGIEVPGTELKLGKPSLLIK